MRLIYVTGGFPYPLTSGYLRHYHLLERLAQRHEIRLYSLVGGDHDESSRDAVARLGVEVHTFGVATTSWRRRVHQVGRVLPRLVLGGAAELRRAVAADASGWADAAVLTGKTTSGVLPVLRSLPLLVDACDAASMRLESQMTARHGLDRLAGSAEVRAMRAIERRLVRHADHVLVASRRDGDHLGFSNRMSVLPNGVDTCYWNRRTTTRPPDTVIFTGKMSYGPNDDAARRLIEDIWPAVRRARPGATLLIVGTSPRPGLLAAGGRDGIVVTGPVDDMRPFLERATVFAAPIRHGAGIQNKLLEALAMGLPVVASTNAADGLVVDGDPPVHVTDDPTRMAALVVDALEAADRDPAPLAANRDWVTGRFDWDVAADAVDAILGRLVDARQQGGTA